MVIWSIPARDDLKNIHEYIAKDSLFYAERVIESIIDRTDQLILFPKSGKAVPEMGEDFIRELSIYSYRLIYEVSGENIYVLAVIHGARDLPIEKIKGAKE